MSDRPRIDLFCEDRAHEELLKHLLHRLCGEEGLAEPRIETRSARGGHGRALDELGKYQLVVEKQGLAVPDLLVVAIDAHCTPYADMVQRIDSRIEHRLFPHRAIACPDPHIERWYMADGEAFREVIGASVPALEPRCGKEHRGELKKVLVQAIRQAGHPVLLSGVEFAAELAAVIDPFRVGRTDSAFRHFLDDVVGALRRLSDR